VNIPLDSRLGVHQTVPVGKHGSDTLLNWHGTCALVCQTLVSASASDGIALDISFVVVTGHVSMLSNNCTNVCKTILFF
jgi:hypothetical protein